MSARHPSGPAVSTSCMPTPGPATEGSSTDDPPSYSECVPYPPPINSNYPKTNSSPPANPSEVDPVNGIQKPGFRNGTYPHGVVPSAPLLDFSSTSQNYSYLYNPAATPNDVGEPAFDHSTRTDLPVHVHRTKTLVPRVSPHNAAGTNRKSLKLCAGGVFGIAMIFIVITTVTLRQMNRTKNQRHNEMINDLNENYLNTINYNDLGTNRYNNYDPKDTSGVEPYYSINDMFKKVMNDFRKEKNMPTLPPNMHVSDMYNVTFQEILDTINNKK